MNQRIQAVTDRIIQRSQKTRSAYLDLMSKHQSQGPQRAHLSCGNQAHAYAPLVDDQSTLVAAKLPHIGIVSAYNDMLSAHQPFAEFPDQIKETARLNGGTAQVAACVPAMCDGVTQGQIGMELSLFSRDSIAMAAAIGLSHNVFDTSLYLGVCDKIVPGLVISAARFGHLPAIFLPAGPMPSGLDNEEKSRVRRDFSEGKCDRQALMDAEMASYHGPGTCTFYGTANTNQMLMEIMGLHLPGASFIAPNTPLRAKLTAAGTKRALEISALGDEYIPVCDILSEKAIVNGIIGLMASGGSTNLLIHMVAMAAAAGIIVEWEDFADISSAVPLLMKVYPNGLADVNHFHAAGGLPLVIRELLDAKILHEDVMTVMGKGLRSYTQEPKLIDDELVWVDAPESALNSKIIASVQAPFQKSGGLSNLSGNIGSAVMKVSAVPENNRVLTAPVRVFHDQEEVLKAYREGEFIDDVVVVVRYQGPKANGMPELHSLTPCLTVLQGRGIGVALVTDGRMSGASGKVPAAIHVSPEALDNGPIAYLRDGDIVTVDAEKGILAAHDETIFDRQINHPDLTDNGFGLGRELFAPFRAGSGSADRGATIFEF